MALALLPPKKIKVYLIGDSTMCLYPAKQFPINGWGMPFANYFDSTVTIDNRARGGRSTRTFLSEGRWQPIADSLEPGDYVLIQFGHNDESSQPQYADRYTPVPDFKTNLARFITETKRRQGIPILITPVSRRSFDAQGNAKETHTEYTKAVFEVADQYQIPVIDLDKMSRELYQTLGPGRAKWLFMELDSAEHPNYPVGRHDNTHFNEFGARRIAELVLNDLKRQHLALAEHIVKGSIPAAAADSIPNRIEYGPFADNSNHWYYGFDDKRLINPLPGRPRYQPAELTAIGDNILLFQKTSGGWPKNYDVFAILTDEQKESIAAAKDETNTTFDNGSTYTEVAALAIVYANTHADKYKTAALKGLDFIGKAQYRNGGWPQYYPLESDYSRCITYNDGAFEGIMQVLKDIGDHAPQYAFVDDYRRKLLAAAYEKGMECIIKTQIDDAGRPTAWCQQYDEVSLRPAWARKFEPPSICNKESADLVLFLMSIDHPNKEVIAAVDNAVAWFQDSRIYNTRVKTIPAPRMVTPFRVSVSDRIVVADSTAPPIWTRYYELKTHKPIFCNRDSKIVYSLGEVTRERRDGYGWYTYDPQQVLDAWPGWQKKWND
jgi:PelA/Pel-15E family pectate lyase